MIEAVCVERIRAAERPLLEAGVPLMQHAAFAVALRARTVLRDRRGGVPGARVVALVGPGNNGGDGLFAAARLAGWAAHVVVVRTAERVHDGGLTRARAQGARILSLVDGPGGPDDELTPREAADLVLGADLVLDAMLGVGARGALRGPVATLVGRVADALGGGREARPPARRPVVVAIDVPSGIGVEDGTLPGPVLPADLTLACGAVASGLLLPPACRRSPAVELIDLGLDVPAAADPAGRPGPAGVHRIEDRDVAGLWRLPRPQDDKYRRGVVGVVAGTAAYPGAAVLAAGAALEAGAGMVRYVGPDAVTEAVLQAHPEIVHGVGRVQSWVLGPGVDPEDGEQARRVAEAFDASGVGSGAYFSASGVWGSGTEDPVVPVVVDAGALALLPQRCPPWVVLTPHAGELARLLSARGDDVDRGAVEDEPLRWARRAHELTGATVLLKGATTIVVGLGGVYSQADAPDWLATAGAGDVLAGLLGTLLAARSAEAVRRPEIVAAVAALAALVHGRAATAANPGGPVTASRVIDALGRTIARLLAADGSAPRPRALP